MPKITARLTQHRLPHIPTRGKTVPQLVREIEAAIPQVDWTIVVLAPRTAVLYDTRTNDRIVVRSLS